MDHLYAFFIGNTATNYVESGFSERESQAMTWIADQKPLGKFLGFLGGSFLAFSWGHWHYRFFNSFGIKCSKLYTQLAILGVSIWFGDYLTCSQRFGANEYFANVLYVNNNLFIGNLRSLVDNFEVLNRKFTDEEVKVFNQRASAMRSLNDFTNRKWIFNPAIETEDEFNRRRKLNLTAPWEDPQIKELIKQQNADKPYIVYGPKELGKLIDETGIKLGVTRKITFGYKPR